MAKLNSVLANSYSYSDAEKQALELVKVAMKEDGIAIAFPVREKNGAKRWGFNIFTRKQLTMGLGSDHAVLVVLQGSNELDADFLARMKSYGIEAEETIERTIKK
jgi:hypothetical protein